ncbi:MAG: flavodoxin-dependent (E)-4-hydroxy-3-methylbut-2-enyl-diphosphate synthase, partial [Verrucomicrobiota bacterium]|nr:flavodoxin-dependent (E)-4-hydroxy-3-methylbut-2-enyl-diphosphate synthase [Verrucomicrobiota bacterium]
ARIKSAIGIGSLLRDGIGDTIRVSLTEDSIHEIPVARALVETTAAESSSPALRNPSAGLSFDPFSYQRRASETITVAGVADPGPGPNGVPGPRLNDGASSVPAGVSDPGYNVPLGGEETVRVAIRRENFEKIAHKVGRMGDFKPEFVYEDSGVVELDPRDDAWIASLNGSADAKMVAVGDGLDLPVIAAYRLLAAKLEPRHPILLKDSLTISGSPEAEFLPTLLNAATNIGSLLCDGIGDAILVQGEHGPGQALRLSYNILQAAGTRIFKTDYVACPSCGRTLFNLQTTTAKIKAATVHLKGVKIAIMGCIVNGPGEMADADFGYVGGAPGKVNLYVGKTAVKFNIPEAEAVDRLQDLIREHGKWVEPPAAELAEAGATALAKD